MTEQQSTRTEPFTISNENSRGGGGAGWLGGGLGLWGFGGQQVWTSAGDGSWKSLQIVVFLYKCPYTVLVLASCSSER